MRGVLAVCVLGRGDCIGEIEGECPGTDTIGDDIVFAVTEVNHLFIPIGDLSVT